MISWLVVNKQWVFSGIGVFVISCIFMLFRSKKHEKLRQTQISGGDSTNIQAGQNVNISLGRKDEKDVE